MVWKQNGLVGVTTQGDLVRAPAYPFHSVLPFQDMLTALVFLQRVRRLRQQHHAIICWLSWLMYSSVIFYLSPEGSDTIHPKVSDTLTRRIQEGWETHPLFIILFQRTFILTNITKKSEISKLFWIFFVGNYIYVKYNFKLKSALSKSVGSCRFCESPINFFTHIGVKLSPLYSDGQTPESHSNSNRIPLGTTYSWHILGLTPSPGSLVFPHTHPHPCVLTALTPRCWGPALTLVFSVIVQGVGKWLNPFDLI